MESERPRRRRRDGSIDISAGALALDSVPLSGLLPWKTNAPSPRPDPREVRDSFWDLYKRLGECTCSLLQIFFLKPWLDR